LFYVSRDADVISFRLDPAH